MGIGDAVNVEHVKSIANAGRGTFEFAAESAGRLNTKILNQLKCMCFFSQVENLR